MKTSTARIAMYSTEIEGSKGGGTAVLRPRGESVERILGDIRGTIGKHATCSDDELHELAEAVFERSAQFVLSWVEDGVIDRTPHAHRSSRVGRLPGT